MGYLQETAEEFGFRDQIKLRHRLMTAAWSSQSNQWTLTLDTPTGSQRRTCSFLFMATGYYDVDKGYTPSFSGIDKFAGQVVHPQQWPGLFHACCRPPCSLLAFSFCSGTFTLCCAAVPVRADDLDCSGKRVVIIGSGATAVTLGPSLSSKGAVVTVLQRSPTYLLRISTRYPREHVHDAVAVQWDLHRFQMRACRSLRDHACMVCCSGQVHRAPAVDRSCRQSTSQVLLPRQDQVATRPH